jgi:hypothetical protein
MNASCCASYLKSHTRRAWKPAKVQANPRQEIGLRPTAAGHAQDGRLTLFSRRLQLVPIQHEEGVERSMSHPLVAIGEWVILDQRKHQRRSLLGEVRIQICPAKRLAGQGDGSFQPGKATQPRRPFGRHNEPPVQVEDLTEGEVAHYAKRR